MFKKLLFKTGKVLKNFLKILANIRKYITIRNIRDRVIIGRWLKCIYLKRKSNKTFINIGNYSKIKTNESRRNGCCGFGAGEPDFDTPSHVKPL